MESSARRKSCDACVRSRRRCVPSGRKCRRCEARNVECVFPGAVSSSTVTRPQLTNGGYDATTVVTSGGNGVRTPPAESHFTTALSSPSMNSTWFEFCNEPFNLPGLPDGNLLDLPIMGDIVSVPSHAESIQEIDPISEMQARTEYVSKRFAGIPKAFVEQAQTSFIHRSLMQARPDPALQDALSVAALYFLQNDSNRLLVIRNLEYKARQLIETTNLQIATQASLLAATQALLIYQLIRIFDGDIRLRAQAEADESFLTAWTDQLRSCMRQLTSASLGAELDPAALSSLEWQSWLMEESIRRTVIMSLMLRGIYSFLKTGHDTVQDLQLSFSANASLWSSQSRRGWLAKRESGQDFGLRVLHWNEDITKATAEDFDELGVHVMVMLWGLAATAQWLGSSQLVQHGMESF